MKLWYSRQHGIRKRLASTAVLAQLVEHRIRKTFLDQKPQYYQYNRPP